MREKFIWANWNITARIVVAACIPVLLMFFFFTYYSYESKKFEAGQELDERGRLFSMLLAENSEYGVVSENLGYVQRTLLALLETDKSILKIEIYDQKNNVLLKVVNPNSSISLQNAKFYDAPIRRELINIDAFQENPKLTAIVGNVRVWLSVEESYAKHRQRMKITLVITLLVLVLSIVVGTMLAVGVTKPLRHLVSTIRAIRRGDTEIVPITKGGIEIMELQEALIETAQSLAASRSDLENKVSSRTEELVAARDEAIKANTEKRKLIQKVDSIVEEERKSIAVEIHDELNAIVIAVRLNSQRILNLISSEEQSPGNDLIKERAVETIQLTSDLYARARKIVRRLRPEVLDMLGLQVAVQEMVQQFDTTHSNCRFMFHSRGDLSKLEGNLAITTYRVIQEALSNIVKHANASKATVTIQSDNDDQPLLISIVDDGKGFDPDLSSEGIGIIGMKERIYAFGGKITIQPGPTNGTAIFIQLPLILEK